MKGLWIVKILAGIVLFSAGVAAGVPICRMYDKAHTAPAGAEASVPLGEERPEEGIAGGTGNADADSDLQLRVRDGQLEWYDGVRWNSAGPVAELMEADPIAQPSEAWQTLAAQLAQARAGEYAAGQGALGRDSGSLTVDEVSDARPQNNTPAVTTRPTTPAPSSRPTVPGNTAPANNDNDDHDDDGGNDDNGDHNEEPAPAPEPDPVPEPEPAPDDTGDGENIEWSGDYE